MAARAAGGTRRVIAVSRWSSDAAERSLNEAGVETVRADLLDRDAVAKLPDAPNVVFMAGQKFGTTGAPAMTWAMNTIVPANCAERYRDSRIVAFSTGNVYPLTAVASGGSAETDALTRRRVRCLLCRTSASGSTPNVMQRGSRSFASTTRSISLRCARRHRDSREARRRRVRHMGYVT
jgi:hypothetical protein